MPLNNKITLASAENKVSPLGGDVSLSTGTISDALSKGKELLVRKEFTNALKLLNDASEKWNNSVPLEGLKADSYRAIGDSASSIQCYEKILKIKPEPPFWVYVGYANVLEDVGKKALAIEQMEAAVRKKYSFELAERTIRMAKNQADENSICQTVVNACAVNGTPGDDEELYRLGEFLVTEDHVEAGCQLMQGLVNRDVS